MLTIVKTIMNETKCNTGRNSLKQIANGQIYVVRSVQSQHLDSYYTNKSQNRTKLEMWQLKVQYSTFFDEQECSRTDINFKFIV